MLDSPRNATSNTHDDLYGDFSSDPRQFFPGPIWSFHASTDRDTQEEKTNTDLRRKKSMLPSTAQAPPAFVSILPPRPLPELFV